MALPGRKTLRQFQCNERLWVTFRRMAEDQEKEIDDVIADAMEAYAQLSGYQTRHQRVVRGTTDAAARCAAP